MSSVEPSQDLSFLPPEHESEETSDSPTDAVSFFDCVPTQLTLYSTNNSSPIKDSCVLKHDGFAYLLLTPYWD